MTNALVPGQVRVGHLVDGAEGTPYQAATLTYEPERGVTLAVPFVHGPEQFTHVAKWFTDPSLPAGLLFADNLGTVALTGLRYSGYSGGTFVLGNARADIAILGEPKSLKEEYKVRALSSTIDGIQEFAAFRPVFGDYERTGEGYRYQLTIDPHEKVAWRANGFSYMIRSNVPWSHSSSQAFEARPEPFIESSRAKRATVNDHLNAQWPLRALLILTFGQPLHWRRHRLEDDAFPLWSAGGTILAAETATEVILRRTARDAAQRQPQDHQLAFPTFNLADVGARGLRKWCVLYEDEAFRRAIEPAVEVVNGVSAFLEAQVMMIALALDAMGYYRDESRASGTPMWRQIRRCIEISGADWSPIGDAEGIAKLIANTNNDLKHPDRSSRPDSVQLSLVADLGVLLMRLQLFDLLNIANSVRDVFLRSRDWNFLVDAFKRNDRVVDSRGRLRSRALK